MKYEGFFNTIDYSLSHNILLIRLGNIVGDKYVNTDFKFMSTYYVEYPTYFRDIEIVQGTAEDCKYVLSRCDSEFVSDLTPDDVFVLLTNSKRYFIGARRLVIEQNELPHEETSIGFKREQYK